MQISNAVYASVVSGAARAQIQEALKEMGYGEIPLRTIDDYMARARKQLEEEYSSERLFLKARQLSRLHRTIRSLIAKGKHADTAQFERLVAQIEGNFAPIQVETLTKRGWDSLTDDELAYMRQNPGKLPPGRTLEELEHVT